MTRAPLLLSHRFLRRCRLFVPVYRVGPLWFGREAMFGGPCVLLAPLYRVNRPKEVTAP